MIDVCQLPTLRITMKRFCLLLCLITVSYCREYTFPDNFRFGLATSAYQIEGAWNVSGKGESIWDRLTHTNPEAIVDQSDGDVACDSYSKTKEDVQLIKDVGVNFYRFSISWSRILPTGKTDYINADGIRYYSELIDELLANGITPLVTIFHFDLPQPLEDLGGFLNAEIADYFADYTNVLFEHFGDRVKEWITINEPNVLCYFGYGGQLLAPMRNKRDEQYTCGRNMLIAHAKAYHLYNDKYRASQGGRIGISNHIIWFEPQLSTSSKDRHAAEAAVEYFFGWFTHPIFSKKGDYPQAMKYGVEYASKKQELDKSKLPEFSDDEIKLIRGSADFLGVNHYTTYYCSPIGDEEIYPGMFHFADVDATCIADLTSEAAASFWIKVIPSGFRSALSWIKDQYNNPEMIITENGYSNVGNLINDCRRVSYHNAYLTELLNAIHKDGCNVSGYTAWSFLDNFEWMSGYFEKFGLYSVDFNDPQRKRTPKMSAFIFKKIIEDRKINWKYTPEGFPECEWLRVKDEL